MALHSNINLQQQLRFRGILIAGIFVFCGLLCADEERDVTITDAHGKQYQGSKLQFNDGQISLAQDLMGKANKIEWQSSALLRVDFHNRTKKRTTQRTIVFLQNGDRLVADSLELKEEELLLFTRELNGKRRQHSVPFETVQGIQFSGSQSNNDVDAFNMKPNEQMNNDLLLLSNGDILEGELESLTHKKIGISVNEEITSVKVSQITALRMNPEWVSFPKVPQKHWVLHLVDGSRLTITNCQHLSDHEVVIRPAFGHQKRLPLQAIASIDLLGGDGSYLSQLKPESIRFQPYFSTPFQRKPRPAKLVINKNIKGKKLRLRDQFFRYGLGMQSRSSVTWKLNQKYQTFRAIIGIDDCAFGKGDVQFIVQLDGKRVFVSKQLKGESAIKQIPEINVSHAMQMTLIVDYGKRGDISDYADWCDPILVKKNKK